MTHAIRKIGFLSGLLIFALPVTHAWPDDAPAPVTTCQLERDPAAYHHKRVQVTTFVSHGFEDFTVFDPECSTSFPNSSPVWLEYGGLVTSGTIYCCGVSSERRRPKQLVIDGVPIPLVDDARFREFDMLIQRAPDSVVRATLIGRFFAGERALHPEADSWGGYGHLGCCSLLAIEQVVSVEPQKNTDLDYRSSIDQPDIEQAGCSYRSLASNSSSELIEIQKAAERSEDGWRFDDPRRVASAALARAIGVEGKSIDVMEQTSSAQGRFVYEWRYSSGLRYMIVVGRPYWLSFYSKDRNRVAWVVLAAYEISC